MNASLPKVAVCLAAYNGIRWIEEQLNSILLQRDVDVTVFISVDRSDDGTHAWVRKTASEDHRVVGMPYGERFGGAAKNFFRLIKDVDIKGFDYVSLADQDDIWLPNKLSTAINVIKKNGYDAYSGNVIAFWPDGSKRLVYKSHPQKKWDYLFEAAGPGCTYVLSQEFFLDIQSCVKGNWQLIQEILLHDWFIYAFARARNYKWMIDTSPHMFYRQHINNQVGVNQGFKAAVSRIKIFAKSVWLDQALIIKRIVNDRSCPFFSCDSSLDRRSVLLIGLNAFECRRRLRDQITFMLFCILLSIFGIFGKNS